MLVSVHNLINAQKRFAAIDEMIEKLKNGNKIQVNTVTTFNNINTAFVDLLQAYKVFTYFSDEKTYVSDFVVNMTKSLFEEYRELRQDDKRPLTDYSMLIKNVSQMLTDFVNRSEFALLRRKRYYSFNNFIYGYNNYSNDLPAPIIQKICDAIKRDTPFNIAYINCNGHQSGLMIKQNKPFAKLYAVNSRNSNYATKEEIANYERFLNGGLKEVKADSAVFDAVICCSTVSFDYDEDNVYRVTNEKNCFDRSFNWLRKDGLLVYVIPACFISKNIAATIAKNLKDVHLFTYLGDDDETNKAVDILVVMGKKRDPLERELDPALYTALRSIIYNENAILNYALTDYKFELPHGILKVNKFRGGKLDDNQIEMMFEESNAMSEFWDKQSVDKLSDQKSHPLLPFSIGQLGLVLTSGCLDGVVKENDGCSHAVKGRVIKVVDVDNELNADGSQLNVSTITSNRVEISMFLPDGTYKCLV